jgi:hypothetical protein
MSIITIAHEHRSIVERFEFSLCLCVSCDEQSHMIHLRVFSKKPQSQTSWARLLLILVILPKFWGKGEILLLGGCERLLHAFGSTKG